jgi:hypothetical protein
MFRIHTAILHHSETTRNAAPGGLNLAHNTRKPA